MGEDLFMSGSEFRAGNGKFDARRRYLRKGVYSSRFPIAHGRTLNIAGGVDGAATYGVNGYGFRQTGWNNGGEFAGTAHAAPFSLVTT